MSDETILEIAAGLELPPEGVADSAVYGSRIALTTVTNRLLEAKKWTRARLAKAMGVSGGRISQILNTETDVSFSNVVRMLHALDLDVASILHDSCDHASAVSPPPRWRRMGHWVEAGWRGLRLTVVQSGQWAVWRGNEVVVSGPLPGYISSGGELTEAMVDEGKALAEAAARRLNDSLHQGQGDGGRGHRRVHRAP